MLNRIQVFIGRVFTLDAEDLKRQEGQTVTEYGVVLGVLIVALGGVVFVLRDQINTFIVAVGDKLQTDPVVAEREEPVMTRDRTRRWLRLLQPIRRCRERTGRDRVRSSARGPAHRSRRDRPYPAGVNRVVHRRSWRQDCDDPFVAAMGRTPGRPKANTAGRRQGVSLPEGDRGSATRRVSPSWSSGSSYRSFAFSFSFSWILESS